MEDISKLSIVSADMNFEILQNDNQNLQVRHNILVSAVIIVGLTTIIIFIMQRLAEEKEKKEL